MAKSRAFIRVVTGQGEIPRPAWLKSIMTYFDVRRSRLDLSRLDERALGDVGITREEAEAEYKRPHWDAPNYMKAEWERPTRHESRPDMANSSNC